MNKCYNLHMNRLVRKNKNITKQPSDKQRNGITPEFKKWVKEFTDEHEDALRELAKR